MPSSTCKCIPEWMQHIAAHPWGGFLRAPRKMRSSPAREGNNRFTVRIIQLSPHSLHSSLPTKYSSTTLWNATEDAC